MAAAGHVEALAWGEGVLFVAGWVRVPEGGGPPVLRLRAPGGAALDWPLRRLRARPDLPASADAPAGFGFEALIPFPEPPGAVSAEALAGGRAVPLGPGPRPPGPWQPRGALEPPNRHGVAGWVLDVPGRAVELAIGRLRIPLRLDQPRPDLPFDTGAEDRPLGFRITLEALAEALRAADPGAALLDGQAREMVLLAGGMELGRRMLRWPRAMRGGLDRAGDGEAAGWAIELDAGDDPPTLDVLLDGTRWQTVLADEPSVPVPDGVFGRIRGGGFRVALPRRNPAGEGPLPVALHAGFAAEELAAARLDGLPPWRPDHGRLLETLPAGALPRVAVVVPIWNAAEDVRRCVASVLRHTTGDARLILVDDASPDPAVGALLAGLEGRPGVAVHRNPRNLGFTVTANRGIELAGRDDVVLLNSDTIVGAGWLDGLRLAAHSAPGIGTVTPLSNNAGAFSVPEFDADNRFPAWFEPADMARLARQSSLALWPEVPTGNGFCLYLRRDCLDAVGRLDEAAFPRGYGEENDLCMRALRAGFRHLVDDRTLVWHRRSASFGETRHLHIAAGQAVLAARYPEYPALARGLRDSAAFLAVRWRVRRAVEASLAAGGVPRPRVLFVVSTQSGGTPQTNRDLMEALADRYEPWLLRCEGTTLELSRHGQGVVETHHLDEPVAPATHRSAAYDACVAGLLLRHGFELVHIRHLAWHGIGLPGLCRRLGVPAVFSFHDFYAACPTVKLLDAEGRFCGGACTAGEGDCVPELWAPERMPPLRGRFVHRWREMMAEALDACDAFVTTAASARDTLLRVFPRLAPRGIRVIPHGRRFAALERLAAEVEAEEPLRVLVPGNVSRAKGGGLVAAMAELDGGRTVEFHLLGHVDAALRADRPGIVRHGPYAREAFADHVRAIRPHLGAVLSIWPETWCHTLTECWAAGLPVLAARLGAQGERVAATGGGWLLDADAPPERWLELLRRFRADPAAMQAAREAVLAWQAAEGRHNDTAAMAAAYDGLYREVLDGRRSFAAADPAPRPVVVAALPTPRLPDLAAEAWFRGDVASPVIRRQVAAGFPPGDPAAGPVEVLRVPAGAVGAAELPALLGRCRAAGVRAVVEMDGRFAAEVARAAAPDTLAALRGRGVVLAGLDAAARAWLAAEGLPAIAPGPMLDAVAWSGPAPRPLAAPSPPGLLVLRAEALLPPAAEALLEDLWALGLATPVWPGRGWRGGDPVQRVRAAAAGCRLAFLPEPWRAEDGDALPLAALAAGLPLLRAAATGEAPGPRPDGVVVLAADPRRWLRDVAALLADGPGREALAQRAAAQGAGFLRRVDPAQLAALVLGQGAGTHPVVGG